MKNLNQLRLSPSTNIQALEAKALRAAAISAVERKAADARKGEKPKRPKKRRLTPIELSTRAIREYVAAHADEGTTLVDEAPGLFSSAHAIISLYSNADIELQRLAKERRKTDPSVKIPKLCPIVRYVLYPSVLDAKQLGSVAIYCQYTHTLQAQIATTGYLFGIPVKRTNLEIGIKPYVDVLFRA